MSNQENKTLTEQTNSKPTEGTATDPTVAAKAATQQQPDQVQKAESTQGETLLADDAAKAAGAEGSKPADSDKQKQVEKKKLEAFKVPEGQNLDPEASEEFKALAEDLGLDQDNAQKVVDLGFRMSSKYARQVQSVMQEARAAWSSASELDSEFGGEAFKENLGVAKKALKTFGTPELQRLLNESGLGNHPEIIRAFYRAGKTLQEDKIVKGSPPAAAGKSIAERLYSSNK